MEGNVNIIVVNVGQGQCTFVEIYTTSAQTTLSHALLFDCGSDKYNENGVDQIDVNLDYIAAKVNTLPDPGFDCIFFSHSDKDHTSLTERLLVKIDTLAGKKAKVKKVWFAGAKPDYTKKNSSGVKFNILKHMVDKKYCLATDQYTTESNHTAYNKATDEFKPDLCLWRTGDPADDITADDVVVYPIVSNSLSTDGDNEEEIESGKKAEVRNRVSMICGLEYSGGFYTICGDATNITMEIVNLTYKHPSNVFSNNNMTTLPHHGSRSTGLAVARNKKPSDISVRVVETFSSLLKSKSITVSAYEKHRHPSLELMNYFIPTEVTPILRDPRLVEANSHLVTAYIDINLIQPVGWSLLKGASYDFVTQTNTFTTKYYSGFITYFTYNLGATYVNKAKAPKSSSGAINKFACWKYESQTDGTFLLEGYEDLNSPKFTTPIITTTLSSKEATTIEGNGQERMLGKKVISPKIKTVQTRNKNKKKYQPVMRKNRLGSSIIQHY